MAIQSPPPSNNDNNNLHNSGSESAQPVTDSKQDAPAATTESSTPSVFVNSEPIREDQVQNAVNFLSHPRVRGSPVVYRRSFLEKKGLTREEIDEAFRRVPDAAPTSATVPATNTNQDGHVRPSSNVQTQVSSQNLQPAATVSDVPKAGVLTRFHWSHAILAVGLLAASGAGTAVLIKKAIVPRLKSWIRKVVLEKEDDVDKKDDSRPSLAEEAAAAAKAAAAAATDVAKVSQEMLNSKNAERRYFEEFTSMLDEQVQEMKSMSKAIQKLEGQATTIERTFVEDGNYRGSGASSKQSYANGRVDVRSVSSLSQPTSFDAATRLHPKSYAEIMAMVQRGEKPSDMEGQQISPEVFQSSPSNENLNANVHGEGINAVLNSSNSAVPWWQQTNARMTEIETVNEPKYGPYGVTNERPVRKWVPPQPPPVVMPEAAAAIRKPKSSAHKERSDDDQSSVHSSEGTEELQRITKISEMGGTMETNGGISVLNSNEIQEEIEY